MYILAILGVIVGLFIFAWLWWLLLPIIALIIGIKVLIAIFGALFKEN